MNYDVIILMATYNGAEYIEEQINSIFNQTFSNWYLIIRDDDSSDKTFDILLEYKKKYPNKIELLQNKNSTDHGAKFNFCFLLNYVKKYNFNYLMFSDQDDVWKEDKIEKGLNKLRHYDFSKPLLYHGDLTLVNSDLHKINNSFVKFRNIKIKKELNNYLVENSVTGCTVIVNKSLYSLLPPINARQIILHDWFLALVAIINGKIIFDKKSYIYYRQHSSNEVGAQKPYTFVNLKNKLYQKEYLHDEIKQASYLFDCFEQTLSTNDRQIIMGFISMKKMIYIRRIYVIIKNKIYKTGFIRNIIMFINLLFIKDV